MTRPTVQALVICTPCGWRFPPTSLEQDQPCPRCGLVVDVVAQQTVRGRMDAAIAHASRVDPARHGRYVEATLDELVPRRAPTSFEPWPIP